MRLGLLELASLSLSPVPSNWLWVFSFPVVVTTVFAWVKVFTVDQAKKHAVGLSNKLLSSFSSSRPSVSAHLTMQQRQSVGAIPVLNNDTSKPASSSRWAFVSSSSCRLPLLAHLVVLSFVHLPLIVFFV